MTANVHVHSHISFLESSYLRGVTRVSPGLSVASQQVDKGLNLFGCDMFFQQLAIVVQQGSNCVLSQDLIPNLRLHDCKFFGYIFLRDTRNIWL